MSQELISVTAVDSNSSDTMSRTFSTTFREHGESPEMLKAMVLDWEKKEVQPKYRRYQLITSDIVDEFSNEIQEVLEELEIEE